MFPSPYITNPYSFDVSHSLHRLVPPTLVLLFLELRSLAPPTNNGLVATIDIPVIKRVKKYVLEYQGNL